MRPRSIVWFEILYGLALVILAAISALAWKERVADFGPGIAATALFINFLLPLILAPLVSRRRSRVAKWLIVLHLAFSIGLFLSVLLSGMTPPIKLEQWAVWVLQGAAIFLLFTPSARAWLKGLGAPPIPREKLERTFE